MHFSDFYCSLKKVFLLMSENKLREDMDDTLLEKLLSLIKDGIRETNNTNYSDTEGKPDFIEGLLEHSQPLPLFEKTFLSLKAKASLSDSIKVFTLHLISIIAGIEEVFDKMKSTDLFIELLNLFKSNTSNTLASSIQSSNLCCFFSIAKHPKGVVWLLDQNLLDYPFSYFTCTSYYVRKKAIHSFASSLTQWTSSEFSILSISQKNMLNKAIERIVAQLIDGSDFDGYTNDTTFSNCCLLTLKESIQVTYVKELVYNKFNLIEKISKYFKCLINVNNLKPPVQDLLLAMYSSGNDPKVETVIKESISSLIKHQLFVPAMHLTSPFLRIIGKTRHLSNNDLHLLFMPLYVLSGNICLDNKNDIFDLTSDVIFSSVMHEMEMKSNYINLISSSISEISSLTDCMDATALEAVLTSIDMRGDGPLSKNTQAMTYMCLESRKICFSLLQLFSSFLTDSVFATLNHNSKNMLMQYLLCFLERPSLDSNVQCEALKHLTCLIALNSKHDVIIQGEVKDHFVSLLCRKIVDKKEVVMDSSLHLATQILSKECNGGWKEAILKHNMTMIIWTLAINGTNEGFLQASALKAVTQACLNPFCWEITKDAVKVEKVDVIHLLFNFFHTSDFFVQRECLLCIFTLLKFMNANDQLIIINSCKENLFSILLLAVKSLDLELKLTALDFLEWFLESSLECTFTDIKDFITPLCESGLGKCLMLASEDYDNAVVYKANNIFLNCQSKLVLMGYSQDSLIGEDVVSEDTVSNDADELWVDEIGSQLKVSLEARGAGLDKVIDQTTLECIVDICKRNLEQTESRIPRTVSMSLPRLCSLTAFWNCLWSAKLDCTIPNTFVSSVFSEHSLSLLDDIVASEKTEEIVLMNDFPDCY